MRLGKSPEEESAGSENLSAAMRVHSAFGPGLLESAYEACLAYALQKNGLKVERQVWLPIKYDGVETSSGYWLDLPVEDRVVVEIKSVDRWSPVHLAQLPSYLKLGRSGLGYLLDFNVVHMRQGIKRVVLWFPSCSFVYFVVSEVLN